MSEENEVSKSIDYLARSITASAAPGRDAFGGHVESLTEAVMGISEGLSSIASAIETLAEKIEEINDNLPQP